PSSNSPLQQNLWPSSISTAQPFSSCPTAGSGVSGSASAGHFSKTFTTKSALPSQGFFNCSGKAIPGPPQACPRTKNPISSGTSKNLYDGPNAPLAFIRLNLSCRRSSSRGNFTGASLTKYATEQ